MKRILVVDDDPDIFPLIARDLKGLPYIVDHAETEEIAFIMVKQISYDCVILDIILDVNKTSDRIMKEIGDTPVVLMSAHLTDAYMNSVLNHDSSIFHCVKKPFKKGDFANAVSVYEEKFSFGVEEDESVQVVKGSSENREGKQTVSGVTTLESLDASRIEGSGSDDLGEHTRVKGKAEVDDDYSTVGGSDGDDYEKIKHISSHKEKSVLDTLTVSSNSEEESDKKSFEDVKGDKFEDYTRITGRVDVDDSSKRVEGDGDENIDNREGVVVEGHEDHDTKMIGRTDEHDDEIENEIIEEFDSLNPESNLTVKGPRERLEEELAQIKRNQKNEDREELSQKGNGSESDGDEGHMKVKRYQKHEDREDPNQKGKGGDSDLDEGHMKVKRYQKHEDREDPNTKGISNFKEEDEVINKIKGHEEDEDEETRLKNSTEHIKEEITKIKGSGQEKQDEPVYKIKGDNTAHDSESHFTITDSSGDLLEEAERKKLEAVINDIDALKSQAVNDRNKSGYTRVMLSALLGDIEEVASAIEEKADLELKCKGGYTALHLACKGGHVDIVDLLLGAGAKLTAKDNEGREPLFFAIAKNKDEVVKHLIDKGAPLNRKVKGKTYLMIAVIKKNFEIFDMLLSAGVNPNLRDDHGTTATFYAKKMKLKRFTDRIDEFLGKNK